MRAAARRGTGRDLGLTVRMILVSLVLVAFYGALGAASVALAIVGWRHTALVAFVPATVALLFLIHLRLADGLVLVAARARRAPRADEPDLHAITERLAARAGVRPPQLALSPVLAATSLAVGTTPANATIVVTREARRRLTSEELEAVLAHELSHVANRDALLLTLASFFRTLAGVLDARRLLGADERRIEEDWTALAAWAAHVVLTPLRWALLAFGTLLTRALSHYRDYAADRGAALLTGAPEQLMSALQKLADDAGRIPDRDLRALEPANAFLIVSARGQRLRDHAPLAKRLARLATIAREMGRLR